MLRSNEKKRKKTSTFLIENIAPIAYHLNVNSNDYNLREKVNLLLVSCSEFLLPKYNPDSLEDSYSSVIICQLTANAIIQVYPYINNKLIAGLPLSKEEKLPLKDALRLAEKMDEILIKIKSHSDFNLFLRDKGITSNTFKTISGEVMLLKGGCLFHYGKLASAKKYLKSFLFNMNSWQVAGEMAEMKYFNLFEGYTLLSHVYRLENDLEYATSMMSKALENGIIMSNHEPKKGELLLLRYIVAKYIKVYDTKLDEKLNLQFEKLGYKDEIIQEINSKYFKILDKAKSDTSSKKK